MPPRRRKVVVAPASSPEKVKYSTAVIQTLLNAQQNETTHAKLVKQLKQLYATVPHDSFMKSFVQVIKRQMEHDDANQYANNVLKFCAKFVADPEYSEQAATHPIMSSIFDWLLSTISSAQSIRFRICQLVNMILNALGSDAALDDAICDKILRYMLERMRDTSQHVRVQAVLALQRLQDPNSSEDPVVRAYIYHLDKDPSPKVRQAVITSLGRNYRLIPYVLERLWDVDERVRRHAYMQMSSYPVRQYKVAQRLKFLEQGLTDHSEAVQKVMCNVMIPQWIESYQRDYVAFVEALKLDADEKDMDRFCKTSKMVLMVIFKKNGVKEMAQLLKFSEENKTVPLAELTIERAICWQAMLEYLQQADSDELEDYMGELSQFCDYIKTLVENPAALVALLASTSPSASNNSTVVPSTSSTFASQPGETMDKLQQLYFQYILQILLEIVLMYDFNDEFGREHLKTVLARLLRNETLFEVNVRLIMETFERLITDVEQRLNFFVELVNSVLEPPCHDVTNTSRQLIDRYLEQHPEQTLLKMQITTLRMKILELEEQNELANEELNVCNETYANLVKPLVLEMTQNGGGGNDSDAVSMSLLRDTVLRTRRVTQATIEKCLQICFYLVNSPSVATLRLQVCELYRSFISRHVQSVHLSTRNWALRASTAFSMLYDGLSKETFQLLYDQLLNTASTRLWKTAIECAFELLDRYGLEFFDLENEDAVGKDDSRTQNKSARPLFNRHSNSYDEESSRSQSVCNGNEFYKMTVYFMDTCEDGTICSAIIEGFCRLILRGKCTSPDIMTKLLLRYFNPTTDPEVQQLLGIFFQRLIKRRRQEIMQKALLNTLFQVLEAPNESPLAEVRPETVIKFVVDSTQPVFCSAGINPHNAIAVSFLRVMRDNITVKELLKLLSKELLALDIKDDPGLRTDLANTASEIMKEPCLDPKAVKNLTTFRDLMLGKIREELTFSSSRAPTAASARPEEEAEDGATPATGAGTPTAELDDDELPDDGDGETTELDENDEEERSAERPEINKSILQEDSDTDLLASPMKSTGEASGFQSPVRAAIGQSTTTPDTTGVKSLRRTALFVAPNASEPRREGGSFDGTFKVPDASALRKLQAAKNAAVANAKDREDFEIPATNDEDEPGTSSDDEHVSASTDSEEEREVRGKQTTPRTSAVGRKTTTYSASRSTASARLSQKKAPPPARRGSPSPSSSSSSSDGEAVDGSPNVTTSRINRAVRPINKVAAKSLYEQKLAQTTSTLPRATRHASRLDLINSKVMTRKSLSELTAAPPAATESKQKQPRTPGKTTATKTTTTTTTATTPTRKANASVVASPDVGGRTTRRAKKVSESEPSTKPPTPTTATRRESRPTVPTPDAASKRTRAQRTNASQTATTTATTTRTSVPGESKESSGASSPIRLKRAAVVLTPLSPGLRRSIRKSDGSSKGSAAARRS
uniref:Nuclear condensin complex subunit 3 C-terminal domain-containing protein n=1 Tax=Anopheles farauti TaxID=69004 RepID=A0A182QAY6_9DIPT